MVRYPLPAPTMSYTKRQAALSGRVLPSDPSQDTDLTRILHLYEIIKRYELLVEYLLDNNFPVVDVRLDEAVDNYRSAVIRRAMSDSGDCIAEAAAKLGTSRTNLYYFINKSKRGGGRNPSPLPATVELQPPAPQPPQPTTPPAQGQELDPYTAEKTAGGQEVKSV